MSANIATIGGRASFLYQGDTPWHSQGFRVPASHPALRDITAALDLAGMNYEVTLEPMYLADGRKIENRLASMRVVPGAPSVQMGTVGATYRPVQQADATAPLQPMLDLGCTVATLGALGDGERCFALIKLPDTITPLPGDDVRGYFLLYWSHDGTTAVVGLGTPIRVVCQNTLSLAIGRHKGGAWLSIRHTASAQARLDEAAALLKRLTQAMAQTGATFTQLARTAMNAQALAKYIETVIPADGGIVSPVIKSRRDTIAMLTFGGRGADLANQDMPAGLASAWAAYNAVTEYFDHVRPAEAKSDAGRKRANESAIFGGNADVKVQALTVARQLVAA